MPTQALWNLSVEAEDVLGRVAIELRERLHLTPAWPARFAVCDEVLGRLLRPEDDAMAPEVREAWRLVVGSGGNMEVGEVAAGNVLNILSHRPA